MTKKAKTGVEKVTRQEKFLLGNTIMLDKNLSPATRLVGWYITDHINTRRGYAWPSQERIAVELGVTTRTVQRAMNDLSRYFNINRRSGLANEYNPTPDKLSGVVTTKRTANRRVTPDIFDTQPPTNCRVTPDIMSSHPSNDPNNYPFNSALATARAASTDVDVANKRLAIFERKLKSKTASDEEKAAGFSLCEQIFEERDPGDTAWEQALRLLEDYGGPK